MIYRSFGSIYTFIALDTYNSELWPLTFVILEMRNISVLIIDLVTTHSFQQTRSQNTHRYKIFCPKILAFCANLFCGLIVL